MQSPPFAQKKTSNEKKKLKKNTSTQHKQRINPTISFLSQIFHQTDITAGETGKNQKLPYEKAKDKASAQKNKNHFINK